MELPKIIFRRSEVYDEALAREPNWQKPEEELKNFFIKIQEEWEKVGDKIPKEISETVKLPWNEKEIVVYVTYGVIPFSDPLTINSSACDIHTITHELIHRIMSELENWDTFESKWKQYIDKYKNESQTVQYETAVNAVHTKIIKKLFTNE